MDDFFLRMANVVIYHGDWSWPNIDKSIVELTPRHCTKTQSLYHISCCRQ